MNASCYHEAVNYARIPNISILYICYQICYHKKAMKLPLSRESVFFLSAYTLITVGSAVIYPFVANKTVRGVSVYTIIWLSYSCLMLICILVFCTFARHKSDEL